MQHPNAFGHKIQIIFQIDQIKDPASAKYLRDCQYKNPTHFHKVAKTYVAHDRAESDRIKKRQPGQPRQPGNQGNP